jgi:hypothetical protein
MIVSLQEVTEFFETARAHYKDGDKSTNKIYDIVAPSVYDHEKYIFKALKREDGANLSLQKANVSPLRVGNFDDIGKRIADTNSKYGNCVEMNCLAGYLIRRKYPAAQIWGISVNSPGDHFFILVNDLPAASNIKSFAGLSRTIPACVVDVWLNTCCLAVDYPLRAMVKLKNWSAEGKRITSWVNNVNQIFVPDSPAYVDGMLDSPLSYCSTNYP